MIKYNFPNAIFLIFGVLPIFFIFFRLFYYRKKMLSTFFSKNILDEILIPRSRVNFWVKVSFICFGWVLLTISLMQPKGDAGYILETKKTVDTSQEQVQKATPQDIILLIDSSKSMEIMDARGTLKRLDYAIEIGDEIISGLKGETVAIDAFTSQTTMISPLTKDYLFARLILRKISIDEGEVSGTKIFEAVADSIKKYHSFQSPKLLSIILLSDGGDTSLYNLQTSEREKKLALLANLIEDPLDKKIKIITIGFGSSTGKLVAGIKDDQGGAVTSSLDDEVLKIISNRANGKYINANDYPAQVVASLIQQEIEEQEFFFSMGYQQRVQLTKGKDDLTYDLFFQYPLGFAILFLTSAYFFPETKTLLILLFCCFFSPNLAGQNLEKINNNARGYMEALEFEQAENIYREIDIDKLEEWQKYRVLYNLGTIKLAENKFSASYQEYSSIPFQPKLTPYQNMRVKTNMATLLYRQAKQLQDIDDQIENKINLYLEALYNVKMGGVAKCYLNKLLDRDECDQEEGLLKLKHAIKRDLATTAIKYENLKISSLEPTDAIFNLLLSIKQILQDINFLNNKDMSKDRKKRYLKLFTNNLESRSLLWSALEEVYFAPAKNYFFDGIKNLKEEHLRKSSLMFMSCYVDLMQIMYENYGVNPLIEHLQKLDISYQRALLQTPIQSQNLQLLLHEQKRIEKIVDDGKLEMEKGSFFLQKSINFARVRKDSESKFMALNARFWINRLMHKIKTEDEDQLKAIIKQAIFNQSFSLSLNLLRDKMEDPDLENLDIVIDSQDHTINSAAVFFDIVLQQEKKEFKEKGQKKPWDKVIPLFEKGLQAAKNSYTFGGDKVSDILQRNAIEYWKEALVVYAQKESVEDEPLEAVEAKTKEQKDKESITKVLKLLKQMEKDDRLPQREKMPIKKGLRPW